LGLSPVRCVILGAIGRETDSSTTQDLTFNRATRNEADVQKLCVTDGQGDQAPVCITKAQLAAILSQSAAAALANPSPAGTGSNLADSTPSDATDTPPVMQINGDNPAVIQVGATYTDLGAAITGPQADLNLGIEAIVDSGATTTLGAIEIDTSQPGTHTIEYVATDQNGLEGAAIRTVIVQTPDATDDATSAAASSTTDTASST
jgi:hypothetical protein